MLEVLSVVGAVLAAFLIVCGFLGWAFSTPWERWRIAVSPHGVFWVEMGRRLIVPGANPRLPAWTWRRVASFEGEQEARDFIAAKRAAEAAKEWRYIDIEADKAQ